MQIALYPETESGPDRPITIGAPLSVPDIDSPTGMSESFAIASLGGAGLPEAGTLEVGDRDELVGCGTFSMCAGGVAPGALALAGGVTAGTGFDGDGDWLPADRVAWRREGDASDAVVEESPTAAGPAVVADEEQACSASATAPAPVAPSTARLLSSFPLVSSFGIDTSRLSRRDLS